MEHQILVCACCSTEHQVVVSYDDVENLAYCTIHLTNKNFWGRVKHAFRYIFGYHCMYGHWDNIILDSSHGKTLKELGEKLQNNTTN